MKRRAFGIAAGALLASGAAIALKPSRRAAERYSPIDLASQVPERFGTWRVDNSMVPVLPDPALQDRLDKIYTQLLARTYVGDGGQRVMLSIAYGADQGSDATAVHRPEFCYSSQGFTVRDAGEKRLDLDGHPLNVRRLVGRMGPRVEPITYWVTLNDQAVLPGVARKLQQIRFGLQGLIPDGMLVRVSNIEPREQVAFAAQDRFLADLYRALPEAVAARYFGAAG